MEEEKEKAMVTAGEDKEEAKDEVGGAVGTATLSGNSKDLKCVVCGPSSVVVVRVN